MAQNKTVYVIHHDNYGVLGVANSKRSAYQYLIDNNHLDFDFEVYFRKHHYVIGDLFDMFGLEKTPENLLEWVLRIEEEKITDAMYEFWCDIFWFQQCTVLGTED